MNHLFAGIKRNFLHELPLIRLYSYLYLIGLFVGVIAAIVLHSDLSSQAHLIFETKETDGFLSIFLRQFLSFLLLYFLGLTVVGVPLLPFYPLYKGFSIGLLMSLAVILTGVRGLFFGTLAFFAQNLVYTVLGYFVCYSSARLSLSLTDLLRGRAKHGAAYREFLNHTYRFLIVSATLLLCGLWEWKVVPLIFEIF